MTIRTSNPTRPMRINRDLCVWGPFKIGRDSRKGWILAYFDESESVEIASSSRYSQVVDFMEKVVKDQFDRCVKGEETEFFTGRYGSSFRDVSSSFQEFINCRKSMGKKDETGNRICYTQIWPSTSLDDREKKKPGFICFTMKDDAPVRFITGVEFCNISS